MRRLNVALADRSYPIHIGDGLLQRTDLITPLLRTPRIALVSNTTVAPLYMDILVQALAREGVGITPIILADGEAHKNWQSLNLIYDALLASRCDRGTTIIALGGGVIGDLAGFAAATYQRGVPFVQVPTTLL
ncbi:MAG: iron-containing alcohol dehydrogenase, partial [Betaproteobacteria bacterium]